MYWFLKWALCGPLLWLLARPRVEGRHNLPKCGGAILAANHLNVLDALLIGLITPRPVAFGAKAELFRKKGIVGKLLRSILLGMRQMPVDRSGGRAAQSFIDQAVARIRAGGLVGIFPEGAFSPDGRLYKARTGVGRIALRAKAPVVPVGLIYPSKWWRRTRIVIGVPLRTDAIDDGRQREHTAAVALTEAVMTQIARLSGQLQVDEYLRHGRS